MYPQPRQSVNHVGILTDEHPQVTLSCLRADRPARPALACHDPGIRVIVEDLAQTRSGKIGSSHEAVSSRSGQGPVGADTPMGSELPSPDACRHLSRHPQGKAAVTRMNASRVAPTLSASIAQTKGYVYDLFQRKAVQNQALSRLCVWSKPTEPNRS